MILLFALPWLVMMLFGAAHSIDPRIPALGYLVCLLLIVAAAAFRLGVKALS